jgi:hypothetical protein
MKTLPESGFLSNFVEVAVAGLITASNLGETHNFI